MSYRNWTIGPAARYKADQRAKKRAARRHYHVCDACQNEKKYVCCDYHCRDNKKRLCSFCRRNKRYHLIEPDLFQSVALAARNVALRKRLKSEIVSVHMESHFEFGEIKHRWFAYWSDGRATLMTEDEVAAWVTDSKPN